MHPKDFQIPVLSKCKSQFPLLQGVKWGTTRFGVANKPKLVNINLGGNSFETELLTYH